MKTILLDRTGWDLTLDVFGNIALATNPYSLAQDAASAIRLFEHELWYNTVPGVPYWDAILGLAPPLALMKAKFLSAALTVPEVVSAKCFISFITDRRIGGQVQVRNSTGQTQAANF